MKKILLAILILFSINAKSQSFFMVTASTAVGKDSIRVSLDTTVTQAGWTNLVGDPHLNVHSATGGNNNTITVASTLNWQFYGGCGCSAYPSNGTVSGTVWPWAGNTMAESWTNFNGGGGGSHTAEYVHGTYQLVTGGWNPSSQYTITITGSQQFGFLSGTDYRVEGISVSSLINIDTHNNTTLSAQFTNISPDAGGHIYIYVNTPVGQEMATCSGFIIKEQ